MTVREEALAELVAAAEAIRAPAAGRHAVVGRAELVGIGWATVELERAARELGSGLGIDPAAWLAGARDAVLGARAWSAPAAVEGSPAVVLLEPDTEGRLAASLARFGEGIAAIYLRRLAPVEAAPAPPVMEGPTGSVGQSAMGPARLVPDGRTWGPHVLLLEPVRMERSRAARPQQAVTLGDKLAGR